MADAGVSKLLLLALPVDVEAAAVRRVERGVRGMIAMVLYCLLPLFMVNVFRPFMFHWLLLLQYTCFTKRY